MKSRKNTSKRGGAAAVDAATAFATDTANWTVAIENAAVGDAGSGIGAGSGFISSHNPENYTISLRKNFGGSKRKSRKSRKTKKGRGSHEGGKKKCPKHCRRHTRRTRKGLKHRKN